MNERPKPTFICKDCGVPVFDSLGEVRDRCAPCLWVAAIPDREDREQCRKWLIEIGVITEPGAPTERST